MAQQSPTISIPKKSTDDVDWTTPIRNLIAQSYGESPDNYAAECAALQRCRQDAVRGAGSEMTARDLLYKYFGQLELLELRFAEIRVSFPWRDAFTNKLTTQTSLAYEKASIIFQIAATHSAIAASQNRSDPEGLKRSYYYFRTSAGMLNYINDNFLHAPSTDLSREVIKFLVGAMLAQATEVFFEKCVDEKKASGLVAKIANQTASMYTSLGEEVKEFMGKGIFDRNWVTIIQIKAKYFTSLAQFHRAFADQKVEKHGDALARFIAAEASAKEANRTASSFGSMFMTQMSPNLPPDAGSSIQELTKVHLALCTETKNEAQRHNDMIYNAVVPPADTLPQIEKMAIATPVPIQDVYSTPEVQKTIGPDIFIKLIPLSVHESASVYSEEKAKLVRAEVERAELAESEVRSALDALGVKEGLGRYKTMVEGLHADGSSELPTDVVRMIDDIKLVESQEPVSRLLAELDRLRSSVRNELEDSKRELDIESRECEAMRVKYEHLWTQAPSASLTRNLRQDVKTQLSDLEAAVTADQQIKTLWDSVRGNIELLLSPRVEDVFRQSADEGPGGSLLDLDPDNEDRDEEERKKIAAYVEEIEELLGRLNKIAVERKHELKDLKEKVQSDDVSHLLLLNRRNSTVEPTLFAKELEKFKPLQLKLGETVKAEHSTLADITKLWKSLKDFAGRGPGARKWDERERRKKETMRRFSDARDGYMQVRDGLVKGLQFYNDLSELTSSLRRNVKSYVTNRTVEREALESEARRAAATAKAGSPKPRPPPPPPPLSPTDLNKSFATMSLSQTSSSPSAPPLPPPPERQGSYSLPPPPPRPPVSNYNPLGSPLPPQQTPDPYANMFSSGLPVQFTLNSSTQSPPGHSPQSQPYEQSRSYGAYQSINSPPPPQPQSPQSQQVYQTYNPVPQRQPAYPQYSVGPPFGQQPPSSFLPPPPPPSATYQQQFGGVPPPPAPVSYQSFPPPPSAGTGTQASGQYTGSQSGYAGYPR